MGADATMGLGGERQKGEDVRRANGEPAPPSVRPVLRRAALLRDVWPVDPKALRSVSNRSTSCLLR